jgi:hypothetical protein
MINLLNTSQHHATEDYAEVVNKKSGFDFIASSEYDSNMEPLDFTVTFDGSELMISDSVSQEIETYLFEMAIDQIKEGYRPTYDNTGTNELMFI